MNSQPMKLMTASPLTDTGRQHVVKAGLDRDVRLGMLEPVPIAEPVK